MSRKKIVAGNWKMNKTIAEGLDLVAQIKTGLHEKNYQTEVIIAAPYLHLGVLTAQYPGDADFAFAAQNCHQENAGAYTGEVSASMLVAAGVSFVILGHSERRQYFGEDETLLAQKIKTALANGLKVIYCVGEPLEVREANTQNDWVKNQLKALDDLSAADMKNIIVAYEPIWAIGTGKTASSDQAQEMHVFIRRTISEMKGEAIASDLSILYGGSCNAQNAAELFARPDVDGGLIGGASLKAADFLTIIESRG